ncbi:hypothetical protein RhiirB3_472126 [Rhizophagus irregularis]|nr:hypothetical protein RhiirB3_472126 [Rhizophagus irregularis]
MTYRIKEGHLGSSFESIGSNHHRPPPLVTVAPEPDEIFKDLLKSKKHGQFLETYIKNNDPLLLFDSPITLKTPVPATSRTSGCGKRGLVMNYYARTGGFILLQQEKEMEIKPATGPGIIDYKNASTVFQEDHLRFFYALKNITKRNKVDEEGEDSKPGKKREC